MTESKAILHHIPTGQTLVVTHSIFNLCPYIWTIEKSLYNRKKMSTQLDNPIDKDMSISHYTGQLNGKINQMNKKQLQKQLRRLKLCARGDLPILNKRLKEAFRYSKLKEYYPNQVFYHPPFPNYIVIDYEATCKEVKSEDYLHEIIEFPAVLYNTETGKTVDIFHSYCKPLLNAKLSTFCTDLTGITQKDVDDAPPFVEVLANFNEWLEKHDLLTNKNVGFVTDGSCDFGSFLNIQCKLSEICYPTWARKWSNLKKMFCNFYKLSNLRKIYEMMDSLKLEPEGRLHSGLDDSKNIIKVLRQMLTDGATILNNEMLGNNEVEPIPIEQIYMPREMIINCKAELQKDLQG